MSTVAQTKIALDESRMLMLGAQILLGFQFQAPFQNAFDRLSQFEKNIEIIALCVMLLVIGLIVASSARHRILEDGKASRQITIFITRISYPALVLFSLAIALNLFVIMSQIGGSQLGLIAASSGFIVSVALWFGPLLFKQCSGDPPMPNEKTPTSAKIDYALTEARVILPGAQAMLGFQFAIVLTTGFSELSASLKTVHGVAILSVVLATILLMALAAYHRIVFDGENAPEVYRVGSRLILAATVFLAIGLTADLFLIVCKISGSEMIATLLALASLLCLLGLWHVWPTITLLTRAPASERN